VPSTLLGLVIFMISLAPGLAYVLLRERGVPQRNLSAFRETAVVICVSLAADVVTLALFVMARAWVPTLTPDVDALIQHPADYLSANYAEVFWWSISLLVVATALAAWVGSGMARRLSARILLHVPSRFSRFRISPEPIPHNAGVSAWWLAFNNMPGTRVHVGCILNDGSFVSGWLLSYSNQAEDMSDRDLTLAGPVMFRSAGSPVTMDQEGVGAVVVSARNITLLFVSYVQVPSAHGPI
jgi:hypothetical protein